MGSTAPSATVSGPRTAESVTTRFMANIEAEFPGTDKSTSGLSPGSVSLAVRAWNNVNMESSLYYIPGLVAVMVTIVSLLLTCLAVVREKEIGTIEQLMVTPIRRFEFILGKTIPYLVFGIIILTIMLILALIVFGISINGSILLLYFCAGIFITGNLGAALLISVTARTQQQALLTAFFIMMPFVLLSGYMFPIHNMPIEVQWFTWTNPMRWFIQILRGIVIKGVGVSALLQPIIMQTVLAAVFLFFAGLRFRKTIS